ncbi:SLC26A/SulP transporter family protein [Candidatus Bathyarchaeota archaeon]|nr:SLC26A/SulP transporter family protein [Candidatus Bathyarchaeota archaeon]
MGVYDFVVGIGVGILLAFVHLVVQTARVPAVRAAYSGETLTSTVRRNHSHSQYLHQVGRQIFIVKLSGYLFFGTIVSVEERVRNLIDEASFTKRPIRFLIIDLWHVTGVDYSAGEAFNRISRILDKKGIILILSGVENGGQLSQTLRAVGVGRDGVEVMLLPDLNSALESCENELLKTYYASQDALINTPPGRAADPVPAARTSVARTPPQATPLAAAGPSLLEIPTGSPRGALLREAAQRAITDAEAAHHHPRWQSFREPLRLMLQIFQGLSDENEDFWFRAAPFFARRSHPAGTVLFRMGEEARGFYLVESGVLREEYDLPQGWLCESIVAGTTFGELPFFSETRRTATVTVERDCIVWYLGEEAWGRMQKEERDVAWELLRVSLKLTSEHMGLVTSYILSIAG